MPRSRFALVLLSCLMTMAWTASASAQSVSITVAPVLPFNSSVATGNLAASLVLDNNSTGVGPVTVSDIRLTPSCGSTTPGCPVPDPGVFSVTGPATGRAGTACASTAFAVNLTNPSIGQVTFTPSQPVVLSAPNTAGDMCVIDFTVAVRRMPSVDVSPGAPGTQTAALGQVSGSAVNNADPGQVVTGGGVGWQSVTVSRGALPFEGSATPQASIGQNIADTGTLTFPATSPAPTGTMTFSAYGPDNATCSGPPAFQSAAKPIATASSTTATASSGPYAPSAAGAYRWIASYSGDANYLPTVTSCSAPNQLSTVSRATPVLTATASPDVVVGGALSDSASVSGGAGTPTGTVRFDLYGPDDASCSGTVLFTAQVPLASGAASSGSFTPAEAGTYRWIAVYSGDAKYLPATTTCNATDQTRTVSKVAVTLTQTTSGTVPASQPVSDKATLAGGANPTGTLTFRLYGPGPDCTGTPVATVVRNVTGNGDYESGDVVVDTSGNYHWEVSYSGDARHAAVTTLCGAANVAVTQPGTVAPPSLPPAQPPAVLPVAPTGLKARARPRRDRRLPYTYRVTGKLGLPSSVTAAAGCTGEVQVRIKNGRKTISTRTVKLKSDCSYASKVTFTQKHRLRRKGGKLKVLASFLGNSRLTKLAAPAMSVRYR